MVLTRDFKETIKARMACDAAFREELLKEGVEAMLANDMTTGKTVLRDYINATVGFETLSAKTRIPAKSLMRMFGPRGNPNARNLFAVISYLQQREGVHFEIRASR